MITGSGNRHYTLVHLDRWNCSAEVWWSEKQQEWHWRLVWEDGSSWGTHMHSGRAPSKLKARADIVTTMIWIEDSWPSLEYFEGA